MFEAIVLDLSHPRTWRRASNTIKITFFYMYMFIFFFFFFCCNKNFIVASAYSFVGTLSDMCICKTWWACVVCCAHFTYESVYFFFFCNDVIIFRSVTTLVVFNFECGAIWGDCCVVLLCNLSLSSIFNEKRTGTLLLRSFPYAGCGLT